MEKQIIDLKGINEYMYGYIIVSKIYEIRDSFIDIGNGLMYNELFIGKDVYNLINEVNFVLSRYVDIVDDLETTTKIGRLCNLSVYLDPNYKNLISMYCNGDNKIDIEIIF